MAQDTVELSRRERQIVHALYRLVEGGVSEIREAMQAPRPSYNSVRVILGILESKGFVRHRRDGQRYVYRPVISRPKATRSAIDQVVETFFEGSRPKLVSALLDESATQMSAEELDELQEMIKRARKRSKR